MSAKKSIILQGSRGSPTFSRGVQLFPGGGGGSNCLFPIEIHITCDFPGGGPDPLSPPLWIHTWGALQAKANGASREWGESMRGGWNPWLIGGGPGELPWNFFKIYVSENAFQAFLKPLFSIFYDLNIK